MFSLIYTNNTHARELFRESKILNVFRLNILITWSLCIKSKSQETERQSGNTCRLSRNLYVMLKFTERPKTPGITLKNMACSEGKQLFLGDFCVNIDETIADMAQFTKRWNWKWIF